MSTPSIIAHLILWPFLNGGGTGVYLGALPREAVAVSRCSQRGNPSPNYPLLISVYIGFGLEARGISSEMGHIMPTKPAKRAETTI